MKIHKYYNDGITMMFVNSTFETNLLCNTNGVMVMGAILAGRITSSFVLLNDFCRSRNLIEKGSVFELQIQGNCGAKNTIIQINGAGEINYKSDSMFQLYQNTSATTNMDVPNFLCGDEQKDLYLMLKEYKKDGHVVNLNMMYTGENFLVSNVGNISDEFTKLLKLMGYDYSALSIGVNFDYKQNEVVESGAFWFIIENLQSEILPSLSKHVKSLPVIKDLIFESGHDDNKAINTIIGDFGFKKIAQSFYSYNFTSFNGKNYDKSLVPKVFKALKLELPENYIRLEKAPYSHDIKKFAYNIMKSDNELLNKVENGVPVIGVFEQGKDINAIMLGLNVELSDVLEIVNECDKEFLSSVNNVLGMFSGDVKVKIWFDNENLNLSGSSLSASLYLKIHSLINNYEMNQDMLVTGNIDKYGNSKFITSLIYKIRCAIAHGYETIYVPIENKLEIESKLFVFEKKLISIKYFENINDILV